MGPRRWVDGVLPGNQQDQERATAPVLNVGIVLCITMDVFADLCLS